MSDASASVVIRALLVVGFGGEAKGACSLLNLSLPGLRWGEKGCLMEGKERGKLLLRAAASPPRAGCRNVQRSEAESGG